MLEGFSELLGLNTKPPVSGDELGGAHGRRTPSSRPQNPRCERRRGIRNVRIAKERGSAASRGAGSLSTQRARARRSARLFCDAGLERPLGQLTGQLVDEATFRSLLRQCSSAADAIAEAWGHGAALLGAAIRRAVHMEAAAPSPGTRRLWWSGRQHSATLITDFPYFWRARAFRHTNPSTWV